MRPNPPLVNFMPILTAAMLNDARSDNGGWNLFQTELIGISWPLVKGWKFRAIGVKELTDREAEMLMEARGANKDKIKELRAESGRKERLGYKVKKAVPCTQIKAPAPHKKIKQPKAKRRKAKSCKRLRKGGNTYESRNKILARMGFACYGDYLASKLWRGIREEVYKEKGRICLLCGEPAQALHHNRYNEAALRGIDNSCIEPVCNKCHESLEFENGQKVCLEKAATNFDRMLSSRNEFVATVEADAITAVELGW